MLIDLKGCMARQGFTITGALHCGAHLGEEARFYTRARARNVWWVEGNPDLIGPLTAHVAPRPGTVNHRVIHTLLGAAPQEAVTLHVASNQAMSSSVLDLGTHRQAHPDVTYVGDVEVPMATIDGLVRQHKIRADFICLDLQGYELPALQGGERFLRDQARTVYCEVNTRQVYEGCAELPEVDAYLRGFGFEMRELCMAGDAGWGDGVWCR